MKRSKDCFEEEEEAVPLDFSTKRSSGSSKSQASPNTPKPPPRPFKAYPTPNPKDLQPMYNFGGLPIGPAGSTEALLQWQSQQAYIQFREQMIASSDQTRNRRGGQRSSGGKSGSSECGDPISFAGPSNSNSSGDGSNDGLNMDQEFQVGKNGQVKDRVYWERRRKNNEAAKRSRDARRAKEDEIAIRAAFLEQENIKLRFEATVLRQEITKLRHYLYTGTG